ncbi:hypothetical protein TBLA_0I00430 [Henningerozyma blattae CBS 6284]|uniref:Enoyl reductase (ER) domain-containing protein n=1 Tax=Henningerozyma blattae (strain ATCC 34711 / CBS 6284 / DSM 70876 / NBRC 10599 / NRRL Y-10934 / UCD 77-7) TaxID=1071380 RepID=I2H8K4_HENB6|nr:hypothetical protein TBLA_0I00430 [Tetrapisispora blattae CBS 6284]CCH62706.1 hypothetical protein TBLA_0I00430 [Tetrapisispora blattae CBS 6284]
MTERYMKNREPVLETLADLPKAETPAAIKVDPPMRRVARPLRHVRHIPLKSLVFQSNTGPIDFSYEAKIKTPIPKDKLVVQISHVGLNPVDLKIKNGYTTSIYGEIGLGREFAGTIIMVGENLINKWREGDEVYGIFYHPHLGYGCLQSSLLLDPALDPICLRPENLSPEEAAGSLFCLGTAFNMLDKLFKDKKLNESSNILINGGTSSVGMFALQLLKVKYNVLKKIVIVTTTTGSEVLKELFPDFKDDFLFINYLTCRGKASKPLKRMIKECKLIDYDAGGEEEQYITYEQGKFNLVLDFVGGYDILAHSSDLIHAGGMYCTTVGDYVENYKTDVFEQWENPSAGMRKMFGTMLYQYSYLHYFFDPNAKYISKNNWLSECNELLQNGAVQCIIDNVYDWKNHKEAFTYLRSQKAQGKLILKVEKF